MINPNNEILILNNIYLYIYYTHIYILENNNN